MIKNYRKLIAIRASESEKIENPQWINLLNTGHWDTNYQGSFTVTASDLAEMVDNFNNDVRKGVPIDTNHDNAEANGWITKLETRANGEQLWGLCEWTPLGEDKIANKIFKFLSPEFAPTYIDPETNLQTCNNVLIAAALTNFPLMKGLKAVVATESKDEIIIEDTTMTKKEVKAEEEVKEASDEAVEATPEVAEEEKTDEKIEEAPVEAPAEEIKSEESPETPEAPEAPAEEVKEEEKSEEVVTAAEKKNDKAGKAEDMTDDDISPAKKAKMKAEQKAELEKEKEEEKKATEITAEEGQSLEEEVNEIADAFEDSEVNIFKNQWYGYKIVGSYEDEAGKGHIILIADPDCDSTDWSDLAHVKYYQVNFTEDEATESYVFDEPFQVKPEFVPAPEEAEKASAYNLVMAAKEAELKAKKADENTAVEAEKPAESIVEAPVAEAPAEDKADVQAGEYSKEALLEMEKKGISKIKCADGSVREFKDGEFITEPNIEKAEEKPEVASEKVIAVEGEQETISSSELQRLRAIESELATKQASEVVSSLVFNEKDGLKMPALMKEPMVAFYLKLNEGMKKEFTAILEKIPAAKIFSEIGDAGDEMSAESAYAALGKRATEIQAENKNLNYGQALIKARSENAELAKLASEHKAKAKK